MHVRPLTTADLDDALGLWARTEHLASVPREEVEGLLAHDGDLVLCAEQDGEVVGVVLGSYDGRRGWIQRLAVDPERRGAGIGRALVDELQQQLAARGCVQVNLLVFGDNQAGRRFWEQLGYDGFDDIVMFRRRLDGQPPAGYPSAAEPDC
jgi:ribosomal protein S18 acetylase RimI-like enzyme